MTQLRRALRATQKSLDEGSTIQASCAVRDSYHVSLVIVVTSPARVLIARGRDVIENAGEIVPPRSVLGVAMNVIG